MSPSGDSPSEGDLLAPWRAVGKLDDHDAAAFDRMLADDPDLKRGLDAAEEEREATIALNEALPACSAAARDALFARIDADAASRLKPASGVARWFGERLAALSPGALAWGAAAAVLLIAVQGGFIARGLIAGGEGTYETASDGREIASEGQRLMLAFTPTATAAEIAALLSENGAEIVAGPKPGGVFVVRIANHALEKTALDEAVARLKARSGLVRLVVPTN